MASSAPAPSPSSALAPLPREDLSSADYRKKHQDELLVRHHSQVTQASGLVLLVEGSLASMGAAVFSNPFEVMKTRMQLQGELMKTGQYTREYNGLLSGMVKVARQEGIAALQKGLVAAQWHQIAQNGTRFGIYPFIQTACQKAVYGEDFDKAPHSVLLNVTAGAISGVIAAVVASPFYMVKTRLQAQTKSNLASAAGLETAKGVGKQHNYTGVWNALTTIYATQGTKGLFHGVGSAMQRTAVGSSTQLASYDWAKRRLCRSTGASDKDMRVHIAASAFSSFAVMCTMNPFDVVMTRRYNNGATGKAPQSTLAEFGAIIKTEGPMGLYKGSFPLFMRQLPHYVCTFVFLEQIRNARIAWYKRQYTEDKMHG